MWNKTCEMNAVGVSSTVTKSRLCSCDRFIDDFSPGPNSYALLVYMIKRNGEALLLNF